MNARHFTFALGAAVAMAAAVAIPAFAVANRTFVASTGNDANACTRAQPCRTFAAALAQTSTGGEIVVVDSAGYGPVTIGQSVSIVAPQGVYAGITVTSGNGVTVNGSGIQVVLRGLTIEGMGGTFGIHFQDGATLHIEHCQIERMPSRAIHMEANGKLFVSDTIVRDGGGIGISPTSGGFATLNRVQAFNTGMALEGGSIVVRDSVVSHAPNRAIIVEPVAPGVAVRVTIERTNSSANNSRGISVIGGNTAYVTVVDSTFNDNRDEGIEISEGNTIVVSRTTIVRNGGFGIYNAGSVVKSTGDNTVLDNAAGDISGSITPVPKI